jgi:galactokinase
LPFQHEISPSAGSPRKIESTSGTVSADGTRTAAAELSRSAELLWGRPARIFRAPGRVNLIGEHTDYNDGFVLPAAIGFSTWAAAVIRPGRRLSMHSENYSQSRELNLDGLPGAPQGDWSDYVTGVIVEAQKSGWQLPGAELLIRGEVPIGAGLSSSAALETVIAIAMVSLAGIPLDRTQVALLCQRAEREFVGVQVGIMDQFVSGHARAGSALLLDCRSLQHRFAALPAGIRIVICNTMVHHQLAASAYNQRRAECEEGVRRLSAHLPAIRALRDVTLSGLENNRQDLPVIIYRRCRHVISENSRVLEAADALERQDLPRFGSFMYESHTSLRDDYEVSCGELDLMVQIASSLSGVYGARMTGGGFGGCTVNLVDSEYVEAFSRDVSRRYQAETGKEPEIYVTEAAEGAEELPMAGSIIAG